MKISKATIVGFARAELEAWLSLGRYHHRAVILDHECRARFGTLLKISDEDAVGTVFWRDFRPYYELWAASVYVVYEGLAEFKVEDAKLSAICAAGDIQKLKRFRNAVFHFQPQWRPDKQTPLIPMTGWVARLHERHTQIMARGNRFVRYNPFADSAFL